MSICCTFQVFLLHTTLIPENSVWVCTLISQGRIISCSSEDNSPADATSGRGAMIIGRLSRFCILNSWYTFEWCHGSKQTLKNPLITHRAIHGTWKGKESCWFPKSQLLLRQIICVQYRFQNSQKICCRIRLVQGNANIFPLCLLCSQKYKITLKAQNLIPRSKRSCSPGIQFRDYRQIRFFQSWQGHSFLDQPPARSGEICADQARQVIQSHHRRHHNGRQTRYHGAACKCIESHTAHSVA